MYHATPRSRLRSAQASTSTGIRKWTHSDHASARDLKLDALAELPPQLGCENLAAVCIDAANTCDVPLHLAVLDQCRHGRFGREVTLDIEDRADCGGRSQHHRRRYNVPDAQSWCEHLGQRADVHDEAGMVCAGQRKHGVAVVMELVVVVILDDGDSPGAGQGKQR